MDTNILYTMVKDEARKHVYAESVRAELEAMGWTVEGGDVPAEAPVRRGRKAKVEE